jgi:hypothetical protein
MGDRPTLAIPPSADIDAYPTIVTAVLAAKSSAGRQKSGRYEPDRCHAYKMARSEATRREASSLGVRRP